MTNSRSLRAEGSILDPLLAIFPSSLAKTESLVDNLRRATLLP